MAVVAVGGGAAGAADTDQSDVAGFEKPIEVDASEGPVVGVADEAGEAAGGVEVLVDHNMALGALVGDDGVDGEDDLLVAVGSAQLGERPGEPLDDGAASGGVAAGVWVVSDEGDLPGGGVDSAGVLGQPSGAGGHDGDVAVGDPFHRGPVDRPGCVLGAEAQGGGEVL